MPRTGGIRARRPSTRWSIPTRPTGSDGTTGRTATTTRSGSPASKARRRRRLRAERPREFATFLERELMANVGVHVGFVYRQIDQLYQSDNLNRPFSAYNVPINVPIPNAAGT